MSSGGFGRWYEEKKNEENGDSAGSNSWFDVEALMPNTDALNIQPISWSSMKESMEGQMPKKILGMGYQQRFQVFCGLLFLSALFFALAFFVGLPMLAMRPQKFAISFTCGSITFMGSFGIMKGPVEHVLSMIQPDRLVFTTVYVGSMFLTLYCCFFHGYIYTLVASMFQLVALLWYLISFLPGGAAGLSYVFAAMAHVLKPVLLQCARFQALCFARCLSWMGNRAVSS